MLSQVAGDKEYELMKKKKVRNLSAPRFQIAFDDSGQPHVLELAEGTVRSRFATPWFMSKVGYFRVAVTVVGPVFKRPQGEVPFTDRKAEDVLQELTDAVELFKKHALGEDAVIA